MDLSAFLENDFSYFPLWEQVTNLIGNSLSKLIRNAGDKINNLSNR